MSGLEPYVVYNTVNGSVIIVKGRRIAERITATANKLYKLLNTKEITVCEAAMKFFRNHHIDKSKITFNWEIDIIDKMEMFKRFFKGKEYE